MHDSLERYKIWLISLKHGSKISLLTIQEAAFGDSSPTQSTLISLTCAFQMVEEISQSIIVESMPISSRKEETSFAQSSRILIQRSLSFARQVYG